MGHALFSQATQGNAAYDYGGASALKTNNDAGGKLDHFNPEQQAQIMADYFQLLKAGSDDGVRPVHRGGTGRLTHSEVFDTDGYEPARGHQRLEALQSRRCARRRERR